MGGAIPQGRIAEQQTCAAAVQQSSQSGDAPQDND
jgi:hypothetical protein